MVLVCLWYVAKTMIPKSMDSKRTLRRLVKFSGFCILMRMTQGMTISTKSWKRPGLRLQGRSCDMSVMRGIDPPGPP